MRHLYQMLVLTGLFLFISSCIKENKDLSNPEVLDKGTYTFLKSAGLASEASENRSEEYSAAFDITKVERKDDTLKITVSFLKGCEINKFQIIWNGTVLYSFPPMINLFVKRSTENCRPSQDTISQILKINLAECIGNKSLIKEANFIVSNASKKLNSTNSDITISNEN
jgi:hypothetical protein